MVFGFHLPPPLGVGLVKGLCTFLKEASYGRVGLRSRFGVFVPFEANAPPHQL